MISQTESFETRISRIEALVEAIEKSADADAREKTREVVGTLLELHGAGLKRIFELLSTVENPGKTVLDRCLEDDLVRSLLLLHELHPENLEQRVREALARVRPYLQSHGGDVELLEVSPAGVRLRMEGSCQGCPSSAVTMRDTIERAVYEVAPDAAPIEVEGLSEAPANLVSLESLTAANGAPDKTESSQTFQGKEC